MTGGSINEEAWSQEAVTLRFFKTIYLVGEVEDGEEKRGNSMKPSIGMRG